jgi:hypothetical protein
MLPNPFKRNKRLPTLAASVDRVRVHMVHVQSIVGRPRRLEPVDPLGPWEGEVGFDTARLSPWSTETTLSSVDHGTSNFLLNFLKMQNFLLSMIPSVDGGVPVQSPSTVFEPASKTHHRDPPLDRNWRALEPSPRPSINLQ